MLRSRATNALHKRPAQTTETKSTGSWCGSETTRVSGVCLRSVCNLNYKWGHVIVGMKGCQASHTRRGDRCCSRSFAPESRRCRSRLPSGISRLAATCVHDIRQERSELSVARRTGSPCGESAFRQKAPTSESAFRQKAPTSKCPFRQQGCTFQSSVACSPVRRMSSTSAAVAAVRRRSGMNSLSSRRVAITACSR